MTTANGERAMKMVVAIIRHERLQEVQDVLDECGVSGVTVTEVKGCGAQAIAGRTGNGEVGDGKIFVIGIEDAVRIRTGEHGPETVQHAERAMWGH